MSASRKKQAQNSLNAAKMTERQLQEQQEAKKLKVMTAAFTAITAVILVVVIAFSVTQFINNSGIRENNTVAATIGETELSNAQLNYFYVDAVSQFLNTYGSYAAMFGLDVTKPLDEQVTNPETGATWADDFTASALENAKATYALANAAKAEGFQLTDVELNNIELTMVQLRAAAKQSRLSTDNYIKNFYGRGASEKSYREYMELNALAQAYYTKYATDLTYDDAALRAAEEGKEAEFSNFSYNYYYLNTNKFLNGGTTNEDGTITYSDEEKAAAVKAAEEAAKALAEMEITTVEEFDAAIAELTINVGAETAPTSTVCDNYPYANITAAMREWITDASRTEGELGYVENATTTTNEDGTEDKTINGYYVIFYKGVEDNKTPLVNVRHILVAEGGTMDPNTGRMTYTDEELAAAKEKAEKILAMYEAGIQNEEAFKALALEHNTDPGSKENGGLYEDVYPGQMVAEFNDWCFAEGRKPGDTGIVMTPYGAHIMYYVSMGTEIYRDTLIENSLRSADTAAWYEALVNATTVIEGNTKYLNRDIILAAAQ